MIVKYQSAWAEGAGDWLPPVTDPADLFVMLYDSLPEVTARQRPELDPALWRSSDQENAAGRRLGDLLDSWYMDPDVRRCAERVRELACRGSVTRQEVVTVAPSSAGPAVFSALLGLDRALHNVHPGQRGTSMVGLSAMGLRYVRTGRLNTDRVAGALLPRKSPFGGSGASFLARCFLSVERISAEVWNAVSHRRLPTHVDLGFRTTSEELRLATVPLLTRDDLAVSVTTVGTGQPVAFQLVPRDTAHLRERMRSVLDALDHSGAAIAVLPDHALSASLLTCWQELLRTTPAPVGARLKWVLVGGGIVDAQSPPVSRAVMLDRDLGEIVLAQDKLVPSRLELRQLTLRGMDTQHGQAPQETPVAASDQVSEDIAVGTGLNIVDASIGRVAILSGDQPEDLESALRHVTYLLRAGLPSPLQHEQMVDRQTDTGGLVLSSGLLVSGLDPAGPLGGGVICLPAEEGAERQHAEILMTTAFQPDELTVTSLSSGAEDSRLWQHTGESAWHGADRLRELQRIRFADPGALLRDGMREVEELMSQLDPVSDPRQLAMAAQLAAQINAARGRVTAARSAVNRVISAARSADAQFLEAAARAVACQLCCWDDQPLDRVVADVTAELDWAQAHGYPYLELTAFGVLARANSLLGQSSRATELVRQAAAIGEELVLCSDSAELAAQDSTATASVLLTSGDFREAAAVLDRSDRGLRRIGAEQLCPPVLVLSARVRHHMGEFEAAHRLLDDCGERTPPDDVAVQASQRGVRALLLADHGDYIVAEQLARSAVRASDWSERLDIQAQARADLASVLVRSNRPAEAALPAAWALRIYERKGDVVSAAAVREVVPPGDGLDEWPFHAEAWVMAEEASLVAGRTAKIGMRLLRRATVSAGPGMRAGRSPEVLVTLLAGSAAMIRPNGQRLRLPESGYTETLVFRVTPRASIPLRLQFLVNLYEEGTLLQEMGVTMPVLPQAPGMRSDER
ncbi:MAG TPA: hypothetical protein VNF47_26690 [Streptosporangiaceae bacterium]|nr:hypothetical protein [Streptosporangiaceae bacterium]